MEGTVWHGFALVWDIGHCGGGGGGGGMVGTLGISTPGISR